MFQNMKLFQIKFHIGFNMTAAFLAARGVYVLDKQHGSESFQKVGASSRAQPAQNERWHVVCFEQYEESRGAALKTRGAA